MQLIVNIDVVFYARSRAEKTTPKTEAPEIARTTPSLVVLDAGVEVALIDVLELDLLVDNDEPEGRTEDAVGRLA